MTIIQAIQKLTCGFFDVFFIGITLFGETLFLTLIFAIVFFAVDKRLGKALGYTLFSSLCFNAGIKDIVRAPRPIGEEGIRSIFVDSATGYSFPSGHTQSASSFYPVLAKKIGRTWTWIVTGILLFLIGVSRLYLGVHWPKDVLFGWILGLGFAFLIPYLYDGCGNLLSVLAIALFPALFVTTDPAFFKAEALFLGFCLAVMLEERFLHFSTDVCLWKKLLRIVLGLLLVGGIKFGLSAILPETLGCDFLEYAMVSLTGFFLCPLLFQICRV